jgi:arylsulfatase
MPNQPNILVLFTDMQRADTIGALGNPVIRTPSLDRLVAQGTAFTNCFSPSPVCVSARCCMHYGQYPQRTGLYSNGPMMDDNDASYVALLGRAGYRTHAIGKCHFTPERLALRGFQTRLTQEENISDPETDDYSCYLRDHGFDYLEPQGTRSEMYYIPQVSHLPAEAHPTQWVADRSLDFLRETRPSSQPWMLFSSFIHPHPPLAPPKPWHKLYRASLMPFPSVPPGSDELHTWVNRHQNRYKYRDQGLDANLVRLIKAYYYATISFVDYQIGRILDELEQRGQLDNTLVLFSSDHGEFLGDLNCFGKRSMHDAASRVPMLARYPGSFAAGHRCARATSLVDAFPTIAAAAGLDTRALDLDGEDLGAVASGESDRQRVYSQFASEGRGIYMVVDQYWKYFYSAADDREFLFDRVTDPHETRNRAGLSLCRDIKAELKADLLGYLQRSGEEAAVAVDHGHLDWRRYPVESGVSSDPDEGLLLQDAPGSMPSLPGYTD